MDVGRDLDKDTFRQGYLQRKKSVAKSVKKRWFCLNSDALITFKSEDDARKSADCTDVLPLADVQTVKKQNTSSHKYYPFEIITLQKTHIFLTDSAYEQDQWVKAFHEAIRSRSFNAHKTDLTSKYATNGKDRRSSTGAKKLSQIKKKMQDGLRPGMQRKSSGVECDLGETPDYQGIPIGPIENVDDDVFATYKSPTSPTKNKSPQIVQYVAIHGNDMGGNASGGSYGQSRASDDSGQGSHDVRNLDSSSGATTPTADDGEMNRGASLRTSNDASENARNGRDTNGGASGSSSTPPPVPAPSTGLSRSKKRVFEDEQIYDTPPMIDEELYDVPPREKVEQAVVVNELESDYEEEYEGEYEEEVYEIDRDGEFVQSSLTKSSAMNDLQKILAEDTDDDDEIDGSDGSMSEYENVVYGQEGDSLEAALAEKGVERSAVDQLKYLLDSFDEL